MNEYKLAEITAIGNAMEQLKIALALAEEEGNDYCAEHLQLAIKEADIAVMFAETHDRGED